MAQMMLQQYIDALGRGSLSFCTQAGVPSGIINIVERDMPIAESYALKICKYLSKEFERPITIADIKDIKTC